jgi:uncharacterized protein YdhG (YjbR/CyaY superfamily)
MKETPMPAKRTTPTRKTFEAEEKAAMRERAKELKAAESDGESELLAKIAEMTESDRAMAERIHAIITAAAPSLTPKTWYGMPAYARDGKLICFFQPAKKFKTRYSTLGFNDAAKLDDGGMWPTSYALAQLTPADEARIAAIVKKAAA